METAIGSLGAHFIKFAELCNRIPVERTAHPPLFTRHPPSDLYFRNIWWIGPVPVATTLIEEDVSFANHPVPFASQPAASHAHGGRWSCKWRLCVCADAAPAEREPIDTDPGGYNRRALPLSSSAPTWDYVSTRKIVHFI